MKDMKFLIFAIMAALMVVVDAGCGTSLKMYGYSDSRCTKGETFKGTLSSFYGSKLNAGCLKRRTGSWKVYCYSTGLAWDWWTKSDSCTGYPDGGQKRYPVNTGGYYCYPSNSGGYFAVKR